jgi:ABC-type branched-subunit amino acid transport system substrate-binding protein
LRNRWINVAVFSALALIGTACSGGSSTSAKGKAGEPQATTPSPGDAAASPAGAPAAPAEPGSPAGEAAPGVVAAPGAAPISAPAARTATGSSARSAAGRTAAPGSDGAKAGAAAANAAGAHAGGAPATPGAPGAAKANYASDVGVTADTIRIGSIDMTSATRSLGPAIAGVQEQGIDAAVKYINRIGGVAGRRLEHVSCDDGGDVARARACYEKMKGEVFALVPSITWVTDVIHDRLVKDKVPWMSWGWFKSEYEDPWMFPCHANGKREAIALATWTAKVIKPKSVGIMYLNVSEDIAAKDDATKALEANGVKVVASVAQEWDSPDESQHVLAMRAADPDFILSFSWPTPVAKFMHDAQTQHYAPKLGYAANHLTGDPGYGPIFGDYIKDRTYGITSWGIPTAPDPDNPEGASPEQKLLVDELIRTNGREAYGFHWRYSGMHHITQSAWVCERILAKAMAEMGPDLTREGLKRILESRGWDSGLGVELYWPADGHDKFPYSYNREFIYKWVSAADGGWDEKRIIPDPVFDCTVGNIPPISKKNVCNT